MKKLIRINPGQLDLIVYDFDGVLTDNKVLVFEDGKEAVFCNRSDGLAIQKIKKLGIAQVILSTERNKVVTARANKLGVEVFQDISDKQSALKDYCTKKRYDLTKVLYIGNDINDLLAMKLVGYPVAVRDADERVKSVAKFVVDIDGGNGVVKKLYERLIS